MWCGVVWCGVVGWLSHCVCRDYVSPHILAEEYGLAKVMEEYNNKYRAKQPGLGRSHSEKKRSKKPRGGPERSNSGFMSLSLSVLRKKPASVSVYSDSETGSSAALSPTAEAPSDPRRVQDKD